MSHLPKLLNAISRLLTYPDDYTPQAAELLYVVLQGELPTAATAASRFGAFVEQSEPWEVEEAFTGTFDVNPECALEVGWHLFGEEYARGMFLVRMREEMRKYNIVETVELPDHLGHVLAVLAAMPEDEAIRFVKSCVQPAVEKMNDGLAKKDTPYRDVIFCLAEVMRYTWGEPVESTAEPAQTRRSGAPAFASDPLRAEFPAADVGCCGDGCGQPKLVQLGE